MGLKLSYGYSILFKVAIKFRRINISMQHLEKWNFNYEKMFSEQSVLYLLLIVKIFTYSSNIYYSGTLEVKAHLIRNYFSI